MDVRERLYAMCISEDGKVSAYVCMYVNMYVCTVYMYVCYVCMYVCMHVFS
jgi:hypothetical protein